MLYAVMHVHAKHYHLNCHVCHQRQHYLKVERHSCTDLVGILQHLHLVHEALNGKIVQQMIAMTFSFNHADNCGVNRV